MSYSDREHQRRTHNIITIGTVSEIDWEKRQFRAQRGEITTGWLPFPADISNNYRRWLPLRIGTQIILSATSGDLNNACIGGMLWQESLNAPDNDIDPSERADVDRIQFNDGTRIKYHSGKKELNIFTVGNINIQAEGEIRINAKMIYLNS